MLYLVVAVYLFLCGYYFSKYPNNNYYTVFRATAFIIFVYVAGMRYNLGVDYFMYSKTYNKFPDIVELITNRTALEELLSSKTEFGFKIFELLIKSFTNNHQILFLIASFVCTILLFKSLRFFSSNKFFFLSLFTYFCAIYLLLEMQALRQALAAGFIYYGLAIRLKSLKSAYIWIFCGCLFHNSALIFLFLLPLIDKRMRIKLQLSILAISLFIIVFKINWLISIISLLGSRFPDFAVVARAMNYLEKSNLGVQRGLYITYFFYLFVYLIFIYYFRNQGGYSTSKKLVIGQNLLFLYLVITCLTWEISFFSVRLGWYFLFGLVICLPHIISFFKKSSKIFGYLYLIIFNLVLIRPFIFPSITQLPFSPYEDYISCVWFGKKSTGEDRAERYLNEMGVLLNLEVE